MPEGSTNRQTVVAETVTPPRWFSSWTALSLKGDAYRAFGEVTAWRVSLWSGTQLLGEQKSFLW